MSRSAEKQVIEERVTVGKSSKQVLADPYNRRFKLIDWSAEDVAAASMPEIRATTEHTANATKAIVYARSMRQSLFETLGFNYEAVIEGYFDDGTAAHLFSAYFDAKRGRLSPSERAHESARTAMSKKPDRFSIPPAMSSHRAMPSDAPALAQFLSASFPDYPTPLDEESLRLAMRTEKTYFRVCKLDGRIVASASAEIDHLRKNAEVSDCCTEPSQRGKGLASALVQEVERDVNALFSINDFYSLARAGEVSMNCAFAKCDYRFSGRLVNNCRMPNGWESIHVWCRKFGD